MSSKENFSPNVSAVATKKILGSSTSSDVSLSLLYIFFWPPASPHVAEGIYTLFFYFLSFFLFFFDIKKTHWRIRLMMLKVRCTYIFIYITTHNQFTQMVERGYLIIYCKLLSNDETVDDARYYNTFLFHFFFFSSFHLFPVFFTRAPRVSYKYP